jgi:hypothetical protein
MNDAQEKEKAQRQGGASTIISLFVAQEKRSQSPERGSDSRVSGSPTWRRSKDVEQLI